MWGVNYLKSVWLSNCNFNETKGKYRSSRWLSVQIDDTIYGLPEQPDLELGDGLIDTLGAEENDLLDSNFITPQEENDVVLEQIKKDYNFDEIKDTFDQGVVHESVEFFYGGDNENFVQNVEFLNPTSDNKELVSFYCLI